MTSYTSIPESAIANVQAFNARGQQRDHGHLAQSPADILALVLAHHPDDSVRIHVSSDLANQQKTELELERWAERPDVQGAYYDLPAHDRVPYRTTGVVTTWTGAILGTIREARVYRHNSGGHMVSMRVEGTNGAMYAGRASWDNGTCITLRRTKAETR